METKKITVEVPKAVHEQMRLAAFNEHKSVARVAVERLTAAFPVSAQEPERKRAATHDERQAAS